MKSISEPGCFDKHFVAERRGTDLAGWLVQAERSGIAAQRWWISPSEIRRAEEELCLQENKGSGSHPVLTEQLVNGKPMHVPEMTQIEVDQGTGADHDIPYLFTLPSFLPEALSWARLLAKVRAGELVSGELVSEEEPFPLSDVFGT